MPDQPTKACTGCGEVKPLDQYSEKGTRLPWED
jgi:hypothetical protein